MVFFRMEFVVAGPILDRLGESWAPTESEPRKSLLRFEKMRQSGLQR